MNSSLNTLLRIPAALLVGALLVSFRPADPVSERVGFTIESKSRLFISGTSNVNTFDCEYKDKFKLSEARITSDSGKSTVYFEGLRLLAATKNLDCDNSKMNSDLCDALQADLYPYIKVRIHDAAIIEGSISTVGSSAMVTAHATLTVTNQNRNVVLNAQATRLVNNQLWLTCSKTIKLTDYGVTPPTALFGLIKVRDEITINFDLYVQLQ